MNIKRTIIFRIYPYGKKKDKFQIRIRATYSGGRVEMSTGCILTSVDFWDADAGMVKKGYIGPLQETDASLNRELQNCRDYLDSAFKYFEAIDAFPSEDDIRARFREKIGQSVPQRVVKPRRLDKASDEKPAKLRFYDVFDIFVRDSGEKNAWTPATYQKMSALRQDLFRFKKNLRFEDITEHTLTSFVVYLREEKPLKTPRRKKGNRDAYDKEDITGIKNSTIGKKLEYLRWFLNWATKKGYNSNLEYKEYHPTLKGTQNKVIYLTKEELKQIRDLALPSESRFLDIVRDIFLFCCFSGLRHSDVRTLKWSDIRDGHIDVTTQKTADSIMIELNKVTCALIKKYQSQARGDGLVFPPYTNQAMNRDLKVLCRLAGINEMVRVTTYRGNERIDEMLPKWQLIGTHTGRRTFIVNALSLGIAPDVVMKWTGHSDYKAMRPYIDIVDSVKARSMEKFNSIL